jgi:hypothetical protein
MEEMVEKIENRKDSYGSVLVKSAIVKRGDVWKNCVTKILPLHRSDSYAQKEKLDYGVVIFFEETISLDRLLEIIRKLPEKGTSSLTLGNNEIQFDVESLSNGHEYDSGDDYLSVGWFFETYHFRGPQESYPREPLVLKDLPLFPDFRTALKEFMEIDIAQHSLYGVVVCVPRYGARIEEVSIGSEEIMLKIQPKDVAMKDIMGKIYCERGKEMKHLDVAFDDGTGTASVGFKPENMYIALISKTDSELLDSRQYHASWRLPKDFIVDTPEYEIEELIRNGETDTVEFKEKISKPKEFMETIVAFANSKGGVILLGVDDHSQIVDLPEENYKDKITNLVRSHCEPQVDFEVSKRTIGEKDIVVIRVEEGSVQDKPYFVRDKGPYIRANATDRIATRYELDEIYRQKQSPLGGI